MKYVTHINRMHKKKGRRIMKDKIQNIVLPDSLETKAHYELFYRGPQSRVEKNTLYMVDNAVYSFCTYLNGCSNNKWKEYTDLETVTLVLQMQGEFDVTVLGYDVDAFSPVRYEMGKYEYNLCDKEEIQITIPENEHIMVGVEISSRKKAVLYGGYYEGIFQSQEANNVELCVATTTCRKEEYIKSNIQSLREKILEAEDDMKNHFYIHVVDNGRTLAKEDIESWHVYLHPNKNTGGSGGYSRGMIESLEQNPKATHVLLMDDDVIVLPESLRRTYTLLRHVDEKHKNSFVSGAMLFLEEMNIQHEDIGVLDVRGHMGPLKRRLYHDQLRDNLWNEEEFYGGTRHYAGWWYCCIPTSVIEEYGLSLPLFIRFDDVEYSLRTHADIMTMNGICIWHMGFVNKFNLPFDRYQHGRNAMIDQAVGSIDEGVDVYGELYKAFRTELLRYNYNGARLVLRALEDYLKGPDFIAEDCGEQILKENSKYNEAYKPLSEFEGVEWDFESLYEIKDRKFWDTLWYRVTYNGQRLWPTSWVRDDVVCVLFGAQYDPQRYVNHRKMIAVNPDLKVGALREYDKAQYKEIKKQWNRAVRQYKKENGRIRREYLDKKTYLTSMEFWKKYLEL